MVQAYNKKFFTNENCTDLEEGIQTRAVIKSCVLSADCRMWLAKRRCARSIIAISTYSRFPPAIASMQSIQHHHISLQAASAGLGVRSASKPQCRTPIPHTWYMREAYTVSWSQPCSVCSWRNHMLPPIASLCWSARAPRVCRSVGKGNNGRC